MSSLQELELNVTEVLSNFIQRPDVENDDSGQYMRNVLNSDRFHPYEKAEGVVRRRNFSKEETQKLLAFFEINQYPTKEGIEFIAIEMDIEFSRINNWFSNQRQRVKHSGK